jgi:tungstate transport system substrate-binding protein
MHMFLRHKTRALALSVALIALPSLAQVKTIQMASTTSTEQSGLFAHLLPKFTARTGITVKVTAVGTGQAIDIAKRGDADVLFVHNQAAEEKFVAEGYGVKRFPVMYNDFVLIGPKSDPAQLAGSDISAALQKIAKTNATFISRGDRSGTHSAELRHWETAGLKNAQGTGYRACGCGMGPALNMASAMNAYVLSDRATWLNFGNPGDLKILVSGDKRLFNQYGVMVVNPSKHPHVKTAEAQAFVDWVTSPEGQTTIGDYKINGESLFFPNADPR